MLAVWKFPIHSTHTVMSFPVGARLISCQMQHGRPTLWAIVDPNAQTETRAVRVVGTGSPFDEALAGWQVFTVQDTDGYVWHIFAEATNA